MSHRFISVIIATAALAFATTAAAADPAPAATSSASGGACISDTAKQSLSSCQNSGSTNELK